MRCDYQIAAVDGHIAHGSDRQIVLQRLPTIARVEGHVDAEFRSSKKQIALLRILANGPKKMCRSDSTDRQFPAFSIVMGDVEIRLSIAQAVPVDRGVRHCRIEMRGFDQ